MVINKKISKIWKLIEAFFAETVFVETLLVVSIISITES